MHCPHCGVRALAEQKYCRSCGISLQRLSQVLADELVAAQLVAAADEAPGEGRGQKFERWGKFAGATGLAVVMLLQIGFLITTPLHKLFGVSLEAFDLIGPVVAPVGILLVLIGFGLVIYPHLIKEVFRRRPPQAALLPTADPTAKFPPGSAAEPALSITERTTSRLEVSRPLVAGRQQEMRVEENGEE